MSYSQGLNFVLCNDVAFALHCAQPVSTAYVSVKGLMAVFASSFIVDPLVP